jgi:hypothetical protein
MELAQDRVQCQSFAFLVLNIAGSVGKVLDLHSLSGLLIISASLSAIHTDSFRVYSQSLQVNPGEVS